MSMRLRQYLRAIGLIGVGYLFCFGMHCWLDNIVVETTVALGFAAGGMVAAWIADLESRQRATHPTEDSAGKQETHSH